MTIGDNNIVVGYCTGTNTYPFPDKVMRTTCHELSAKVLFAEVNTGDNLVSPSHNTKYPCRNAKYNEGEPCKTVTRMIQPQFN